MEHKTKYLTEKLIETIQSGRFDQNDVDMLFMRLREYSSTSAIFEEFAHFVAHSRERHKGIVNKHLEGTYLSLKFLCEYPYSNVHFDIHKPFPFYVLKLLKFLILGRSEQEVKDHLGLVKDHLSQRIDSIFVENKVTQTAQLRNKLSRGNAKLIEFLLSRLMIGHLFEQDVIITNLIQVLRDNGLTFDEKRIRELSNQIMVCLLVLLDKTNFDFGGPETGFCRIGSEVESVEVDFRKPDAVEPMEGFGKLHIKAQVPFSFKEKNGWVMFQLVTTSLDAEEFCDTSMLTVSPFPLPENPTIIIKTLDFESVLVINEHHKIMYLAS